MLTESIRLSEAETKAINDLQAQVIAKGYRKLPVDPTLYKYWYTRTWNTHFTDCSVDFDVVAYWTGKVTIVGRIIYKGEEISLSYNSEFSPEAVSLQKFEKMVAVVLAAQLAEQIEVE